LLFIGRIAIAVIALVVLVNKKLMIKELYRSGKCEE